MSLKPEHTNDDGLHILTFGHDRYSEPVTAGELAEAFSQLPPDVVFAMVEPRYFSPQCGPGCQGQREPDDTHDSAVISVAFVDTSSETYRRVSAPWN
jgi:hypothetical protein